ncbi:MAG: TIGR02996 domain-containing protein [Planctomycetes bacterium]|nr:TIGR02996 domain-containing protein [Planctomycetota bacterium]
MRTIRGSPHDDTPRLVFADWLEENGRAERAEYIRLQCVRESFDESDPRRRTFLVRERQIWRVHAADWRSELPPSLKRFPFRRGFVRPADLEMSAEQFLNLADDYLDCAPQWTARLTLRERDSIPDLLRAERLERLTGLSLHVDGADTGGLRELLASPGLANLHELRIEGHPIAFEHLRVITRSPALADLRRLGVFCNQIQLDGAEAIAASPYFAKLESLDLNGCGIGDEGLRALASSPNLPSMRELNLPNNGLHNNSAAAIIASRTFKRLVGLGLFGNHLGDAGARSLSLGRNLERLTHLDLGLNRIGPDGGRALANSPFLLGLRQLYLGGNRVSDDPHALSALRTRFGERVTV